MANGTTADDDRRLADGAPVEFGQKSVSHVGSTPISGRASSSRSRQPSLETTSTCAKVIGRLDATLRRLRWGAC